MNQNIQNHNSSLREELDFQLGEAYNDYKILNKYPSANDLIDAMVEICLREFEKHIDEMWNKTNYTIDGEGFYEDIKKELLKK